MDATTVFKTARGFAKHLRVLKGQRVERKTQAPWRKKGRRPLTRNERETIFAKTAGRCHICGGEIDGDWEADHVFAYAQGGAHTVDNYLPAHPICNNYRWFYGAEEFQWILKLGVWFKNRIEKEDVPALELTQHFVEYESTRDARRKK